MTVRPVAIALLVLALPFRSVGADDPLGYWAEYTINWEETDWVEKIPGTRKVSQLSVPGTHDTVAQRWFESAIVQTQTLTIPLQLKAGIRALDIRLKCSNDGKLAGYHGKADQFISFDEILYQMAKFLYDHPREVIFARIKNEAANGGCAPYSNFQGRFKAYFDDPGPNAQYFWRRPQPTAEDPNRGKDPTLGEVRGRIVVLQDFPEAGYGWFGLGWDDDFDKQDAYELKQKTELYDRKWERVRTKLQYAEANATGSRKAVCNFLSASAEKWTSALSVFPWWAASGKKTSHTNAPQESTGISGTPEKTSKVFTDFHHVCAKRLGKTHCEIFYMGTNLLTMHWLRNANPRYKYTGFVFADFPGPALIREVIAANGRYP